MSHDVAKLESPPVPQLDCVPVCKRGNFSYYCVTAPPASLGCRMAETQNFLDNLKNLRLVMSVALEHTQENSDHFVRNATGNDVRHFDRLISQIRTVAGELEREFNTAEYLISRGSANFPRN